MSDIGLDVEAIGGKKVLLLWSLNSSGERGTSKQTIKSVVKTSSGDMYYA